MIVRAHGTAELRSGRVLLETDWRPGDAGRPGLLSLRLEDQETYESVEGRVRLDPWIADEYLLIEHPTGDGFILCGSPAVVALDAVSLALISSLGLEHEEGEIIGTPWQVEIAESRRLILATERRVWCVDERGAIRWVWGCQTGDRSTQVSAAPVPRGDRIRVPLVGAKGELQVELLLNDGLLAPV